MHRIISKTEATYLPDVHLRFNVFELPTWFAYATPAGTSNIAADRCIRQAYLDEPRLWLETVVLPQLDWLDAQSLPLAIVCANMWGTENTEAAMDFDGPIEAARNPRLARWCAEVPSMLALIATMVDHRADYVGTYANDPDVAAARQRGRQHLAAFTFDSLNPVQRGGDSVAFDQVCHLLGDDPIYRELLRIRRRLERPCWGESRPRWNTMQWASDGWGFMFQERHLLLTGEQWAPLGAIRSLGCPIARMTHGVPEGPHVDPDTGGPWQPWAWEQTAARRARAEGDRVVMNLRNPAREGMSVKDFE